MLFLCAGWPNPTISPLEGEPNEKPWRSGADPKSPVAGRPDCFFSCANRPNPPTSPTEDEPKQTPRRSGSTEFKENPDKDDSTGGGLIGLPGLTIADAASDVWRPPPTISAPGGA